MTIAMFSLIIFSLVMMATMNTNFTNMMLGDEENAGLDVRTDVYNANPVDDFTGNLDERDVDTSAFTSVDIFTQPAPFGADVRVPGTDD